jgi:hypothetical protein
MTALGICPAFVRRMAPVSILCSWAFDAANARNIAGFSKKRVTEIDWEAVVLPLNYARNRDFLRFGSFLAPNRSVQTRWSVRSSVYAAVRKFQMLTRPPAEALDFPARQI